MHKSVSRVNFIIWFVDKIISFFLYRSHLTYDNSNIDKQYFRNRYIFPIQFQTHFRILKSPFVSQRVRLGPNQFACDNTSTSHLEENGVQNCETKSANASPRLCTVAGIPRSVSKKRTFGAACVGFVYTSTQNTLYVFGWTY